MVASVGVLSTTDRGYHRPIDPPPGPRWEHLLGKREPVVAFLSLYVIENSGVRQLAAILREQGIRVHELYFKDWLNNRVEPPSDEEVALMMRELRRIRPDIVGISVRASAFHRMASDLTERIRRELDVPVLWGGMHPTSVPEDCLRVADLIAVGEAEESVAELLRRTREGQDATDIPGLWVHTAEGIARNGTAPLVADLDALPFRDFHSPDKVYIDGRRVIAGDPYAVEPIYLLMASRGCPFPSCAFCSNSVMDRVAPGEKYYRLRSLDDVFEEVAYARRVFPNLRRIRFDDEEFPVERAWFDEFCERWPTEGGMAFEIHMDPRVVTQERLERLKAAGMDAVFMGIQHTAKVNRDLYCRNVSDDQVLKAAHAIHDSGLRAGYQVILDDPVSNDDDKSELFDLLLQLPRPYEMVLFSLAIYPGSALAEELLRRGLIGESDIEGQATKVFDQFRVDLSYPRSPSDRFWTGLVVLVSKDFVPKRLLRRMAHSRRLAAHPDAVVAMAYGANLVKIGVMGVDLVRRGEMSWGVVRRWLSLKSLVTF